MRNSTNDSNTYFLSYPITRSTSRRHSMRSARPTPTRPNTLAAIEYLLASTHVQVKFVHRLNDITMAPPKSYRQQQTSKPDQLNQPPTFVTEQEFNATINDLAQEMKKELNSIRHELRNEFHSGAVPKGGRDRCGTEPDPPSVWKRPKQVPQPKHNISGTGKSKSGSKTREGSHRPPKTTPSRKPVEHQTASTKEGSASCAGAEEVYCIACRSDDVPVFQAARLPCKHHWCNACLRRIFNVSTLDRQFMPPKCCSQECIALKHVEKLFDNDFKRRWNAKYREYMG